MWNGYARPCSVCVFDFSSHIPNTRQHIFCSSLVSLLFTLFPLLYLTFGGFSFHLVAAWHRCHALYIKHHSSNCVKYAKMDFACFWILMHFMHYSEYTVQNIAGIRLHKPNHNAYTYKSSHAINDNYSTYSNLLNGFLPLSFSLVQWSHRTHTHT